MDMFSALCWLCPTCCGVEYRSENSKEQGSFMTFFFFFFLLFSLNGPACKIRRK